MFQTLRKAFDYVVSNFGFNNSSDFFNSTIHSKFLIVTLPVAAISGFVENFFGMEIMTMVAIATLLGLELATGLIASKVKKIKIESKKFGRFGLKLLVWFTLFFVVHALALQYKTDDITSTLGDNLWYHFYKYLHSSLMIYVCLEYLISVLENFGAITGEDTTGLINMIRKKSGHIKDIDKKPKPKKTKK